ERQFAEQLLGLFDPEAFLRRHFDFDNVGVLALAGGRFDFGLVGPRADRGEYVFAFVVGRFARLQRRLAGAGDVAAVGVVDRLQGQGGVAGVPDRDLVVDGFVQLAGELAGRER